MTLDQLQLGESARICSVGGTGALRRRLMDMGLTPGTVIYIRKMAPMGDPIEIHVRGYELTLRKEDAAWICVEKSNGQEILAPIFHRRMRRRGFQRRRH